jgi:ubiquinone/menaquinone biosynthesis C-methylase UbiE
VPALIERAGLRAAAEETSIDFRVADAQALAFEDARFDAVVSVLGVMFAPDQEEVFRRYHRGTDGTIAIESRYLQAIAMRA